MEVMENLRQHETPSNIRRQRNEDTGERTPQRRRTFEVTRSLTGAKVSQPEPWIPEDPDDIPSFLPWLAHFQTELDNVKEEKLYIGLHEFEKHSILHSSAVIAYRRIEYGLLNSRLSPLCI